MQAWFKLEERGLKQMDDLVDRLKQTVIDVRTQTWITRLVRTHLCHARARARARTHMAYHETTGTRT